MSAGVSKQDWLELKIAECLVESDDFDLIAMGRSEGAGCYCYANNVLKNAIEKVSGIYPYIVLDNEAGLENLSRRIVKSVNLLVMVTDSSCRGMQTIVRLHEMTKEMNINYQKLAVVINRLRKNELPTGVDELQRITGADFIIGLPDDEELYGIAEAGRGISEINPNNPLIALIDKILDKAGLPA
jgi:CO dehydrogenase maturation factor